MKIVSVFISALFASVPLVQATEIWVEDFDLETVGTTAGTNSNIGSTQVGGRNSVTTEIVAASSVPGFTKASGNVLKVVDLGNNDFAAMAHAPGGSFNIPSISPSEEYIFAVDFYFETTLARDIGEFQPRLTLNGTGGNGNTLTSSVLPAGTVAGEYTISYSGTIADFLTSSFNPNAARPFLFIDQRSGSSTTFYVDNLRFETIEVVPTETVASSPMPSNGKELVPFDCQLVWGSTAPPDEYNVYLSVDQDAVVNGDPVASKGSVTLPTFNPHGLAYGQTYYWRVDSVYSGGTTLAGEVWSFTTVRKQAAERPNIIYIMADDLSHVGLSIYGATALLDVSNDFPETPFSTPRIDSLAETGMLFNHCYTLPVCEPTRVALMSGVSNIRNFTGHRDLSESTVTFANVLQDAGYATCLSGKWKQGGSPSTNPAVDTLNRFGFDEYCAFDYGGVASRFKNPRLVENGVTTFYNSGEYGPDLINDYALDFIERHQDGPFFLYYSMVLVHTPIVPTPDSAGTAYQDAPTSSSEDMNDNRYYPDMVAYMDKMVGQLIDKLDDLGIREDTIIIFSADNGTRVRYSSRLGDGSIFPGGKGHDSADGIHVPLLVNQPGTVPSGPGNAPLICDDLILLRDIYPTVCDIADASISEQVQIDGRSFYPQALGNVGNPRPYLFQYSSLFGSDLGSNPPNNNGAPHVGHFSENDLDVYVFDADYKLYDTGQFFDLQNDVLEESPLNLNNLTGEQQTIHDYFAQELATRAYQEVSSISLGQGNLQLKTGDVYQAKATVLPADSSRNGLKWRSSSPGVATVDKEGVITAVGTGSTTITVQSFDLVASQSFDVTVVVQPADNVGDGITNAWRAAYFGGDGSSIIPGISCATCDPDFDGRTNQEEFNLGGNPTVADRPTSLVIQTAGGSTTLEYVQPLPSGYTGLSLLYTVEESENLKPSSWRFLPGYYEVESANQSVSIPVDPINGQRFYRINGQAR
ncbi:MAG: sulfatase-like hydrolase/transferase [Verrucomicrobiota bacterium]